MFAVRSTDVGQDATSWGSSRISERLISAFRRLSTVEWCSLYIYVPPGTRLCIGVIVNDDRDVEVKVG